MNGYDYCCGANGGTWDEGCIWAVPQYCEPEFLCQDLKQCKNANDCPEPKGCVLHSDPQTLLVKSSCDDCTADYDCRHDAQHNETCNNGTCVP
jgi:hypothetical protein